LLDDKRNHPSTTSTFEIDEIKKEQMAERINLASAFIALLRTEGFVLQADAVQSIFDADLAQDLSKESSEKITKIFNKYKMVHKIEDEIGRTVNDMRIMTGLGTFGAVANVGVITYVDSLTRRGPEALADLQQARYEFSKARNARYAATKADYRNLGEALKKSGHHLKSSFRRTQTAVRGLSKVSKVIGWAGIVGGSVYCAVLTQELKSLTSATLENYDSLERLQNRVNNMNEMVGRLATDFDKIAFAESLESLVTLLQLPVPSSSFLYAGFHKASRAAYPNRSKDAVEAFLAGNYESFGNP
jgi:hypothetical protein